MIRVIVCGGRTFGVPVNSTEEAAFFAAAQRKAQKNVMHVVLGPNYASLCDLMIIEGGAKGADETAREWAKELEVRYNTVFADWERYGKSAGHIRNKKMLEESPDFVLAFPGGRGTENMIYQAKQIGIPVLRVEI